MDTEQLEKWIDIVAAGFDKEGGFMIKASDLRALFTNKVLVPVELVQIHDRILCLSGYPDSYPMKAMKIHLRKLQRELSAVLAASQEQKITQLQWDSSPAGTTHGFVLSSGRVVWHKYDDTGSYCWFMGRWLGNDLIVEGRRNDPCMIAKPPASQEQGK